MTASRRKANSAEGRPGGPGGDDPVLGALAEVEAQYRATGRRLHQEIDELQRELASARQETATLASQLMAQRDAHAEERHRAQQQHQHIAEALGNGLREFYRSTSPGNVYDLILKTCLTLTGATRGLYVTVGGNGPSRVRAAVDVDEYPSSPPSSFISSLCRLALENEGVSTYNNASVWPEQPGHDESFRNCLAAPVVLRNDPSGVVIVADKAGGDFDEHDADVLLSVGSHAAVVIENTRLEREVQDAYLSIVTVLAETIAARHHQAPQYLEIGARTARLVAERLGLSEHERSVAFYSALLHDIGNIGVSDGVLNKPGQLLDAEWALIRAHTQIGYDLLHRVPLLEVVAAVVRHHHECFDGSGYPDGLKGEAIPMPARIVAVVAAYGAMQAPRSYRPALTSEEACERLREGAGSQFDPAVVDAFLAVVNGVAARTMRDKAGETDYADMDRRPAPNLLAP